MDDLGCLHGELGEARVQPRLHAEEATVPSIFLTHPPPRCHPAEEHWPANGAAAGQVGGGRVAALAAMPAIHPEGAKEAVG